MSTVHFEPVFFLDLRYPPHPLLFVGQLSIIRELILKQRTRKYMLFNSLKEATLSSVLADNFSSCKEGWGKKLTLEKV